MLISFLQALIETMEVERIFSADQIQVHPELGQLLREYTKATIRANPDDVLEFSWNYFKKKVAEQEKKNKKANGQSDDKSVNFDEL